MKILEPFLNWQSEIRAVRRDIHAHPELSYQEQRTSDLVAAALEKWGITVHRGLGGTGVVGEIKGKGGSSRAIGLRADLDALPMQELNTFAHASQNTGKMHGCGHDGHTAMLLNAAHYLAETRNFDGTVYVIFQPAEEAGAGAKRMMDDGLFTKFPMQAVFGMHNWPGMPVGSFGVTPGPIMASSNEFCITIKGKGAHGGMPNLGIDPVMTAVQIAQTLQTIITRNRNPLDAAVLSITQIHAGSADNVIPTEAVMRGTVEHSANAMGATADFLFTRSYPPTINHPEETAFCVKVMQEIVGSEHVNSQIQPSMGAEDFAYMLLEVPGCYVWIGNGQGDHRDAGHGLGPCMLHNGSYDFNDDLLPIGATYWVKLAEDWFKR